MAYNEMLDKLIKEVALFNEIKIGDIPDIDLYMDQITTFFDRKLEHMKRGENDSILTKTMINNYTKGKILTPSNKKKYNKEHIILLILIYNLKQVISMNDIQTLLSPLITELMDEEGTAELDSIYSAFLETKKEELDHFEDTIDSKLELIKEKSKDIEYEDKQYIELLLMVTMLLNQANLNKRLAEKIIDDFFVAKPVKKK